jgi:hypothetical protein
MNQDFAHHHQIPLQERREKREVKVINRRPIESGDITHVAKVGMRIHNDEQSLPIFVTK